MTSARTLWLCLLVACRGGGTAHHPVDDAGTGAGTTPGSDAGRTDLDTGNFANVGSCSTGRHQIRSDAPFGLWVWGWGTPNTTPTTGYVSYGYPGGMNVAPINNVIL